MEVKKEQFYSCAKKLVMQMHATNYDGKRKLEGKKTEPFSHLPELVPFLTSFDSPR